MRKEFSNWIEKFGLREARFLFLTGDLGFGALENVQSALGDRFINLGVSEQNMVSVAAGLAREGLKPLCYSIAPFAVFRPYEQIRLDVALNKLPVKIVGNGGGYGYGIMGASHHALEDIAVLSPLPGFRCFVPIANSDVDGACDALFAHPGPGYLRLGYGVWPEANQTIPPFAPVRRLGLPLTTATRLTVVGLGPVLLNLLSGSIEDARVDFFAASVVPLHEDFREIEISVRSTGQLWVIEEHVARGGLGEHLAAVLASRGVAFTLNHSHAQGYPEGIYGSQNYHQRRSALDANSLQDTLARILRS
jgi:transketolase